MRNATIIMALSLLVPCVASSAPAFKHIVIVFQENRTPDNLFGSNPAFEPGVDIAASGVTSKGVTVPLASVPLADCYDISHSHASFEAALNYGFDREPLDQTSCTSALPGNPQFAYVDNSTGVVQPYFDLARDYGFANRMFQTNQGPSFPAHQFIFSGTSAPSAASKLFAAENMSSAAGCIGPLGETVAMINFQGSETAYPPQYPCFEHRTLSDLLDAASPPLSWRYYTTGPGSIWTAPDAIAHICGAGILNGVLGCLGTEWLNHVVPNNPSQVLTDIASCNLPAVSWVIPNARESDHANVNNGTGPQWVASIVNSIGAQTCVSGENYWQDTAILIAWDDWGGWFDHVKPVENIVNVTKWGSGYTYGFRVPLLVVSAYTPAGTVSNANLDFGSLLYFIEKNFGLGFIGPGTGVYTQYADYHAAQKPFGTLASFFTLTSPKPFVAIPTTLDAQYFIHAPSDTTPPDND